MVSDACRRFGVLEGSPTGQTSITPTARQLARSQRSKRSEGQAAKRSTGLHQPFLEMARDAGIPIAEGRPVNWLSGRGHLNECLSGRASLEVIGILGQIHEGLGGDGAALARKAEGSRLIPDLIHEEFGCIIEVDEVQHFTTARPRTFEWYPAEADLGFDPSSINNFQRGGRRGEIEPSGKDLSRLPIARRTAGATRLQRCAEGPARSRLHRPPSYSNTGSRSLPVRSC